MLVTQRDVLDIEALNARCDPAAAEQDVADAMAEFFSQRLHLLLTCGYDELRYAPPPALPKMSVEVADTPMHQMRLSSSKTEQGGAYWAAVRRAATGAWYYVGHGKFHIAQPREKVAHAGVALIPIDIARKAQPIYCLPLADIVTACRSATRHSAAVALPNIWVPPEHSPTIELADSATAIIEALKREQLTLDELNWREMEDVVAELLRARGLAVTVTRRTADGGRDVIARGELIPGEPSTLVVEVKHKRVVTLPDVRNTLWANRDFPLVMIATSGRFSAGVIREKSGPDLQFRLTLKDRVGLTQWISEYQRTTRR